MHFRMKKHRARMALPPLARDGLALLLPERALTMRGAQQATLYRLELTSPP